ncbi:MAG: COQ9 family protein [Acidocella sp.]|nr:COQ9 family protein [Acidocella sp.]
MSEDAKRDELVEALLAQVPFDGWTSRALRHALVSIGEPPDDGPIYFPGGAAEMIAAFCALADERMIAAAQAADLAAYRVPARVRAIIALRFEQNRPYKEAIRRAVSWLAVPTHLPLATKITGATVDAIWHAAGDTSADFNWYTKRGLLAAAYTPTMLYWLRDSSDDDAASLAFLDRRLAGVGRLTSLRHKAEGRLQRLVPKRA